MCGLAGIVNLNKKLVERKKIEQMIEIAKHRGPDDKGFLINQNVGLGHCRLSIIDLSEAGHQPMSNEDGTIWIVYNGEIYNYLELREELKKNGHQFKSNTDTEVVLYAYEEWGERCLNKFNGMWAFAIWDSKNQRLFCARDRFGIKPFYYYYDKNNSFVFSSEIKQLLTLQNIHPTPNDNVIYNYLTFGFENYSEETSFQNIKQLLGGHSLTIDLVSESPTPIIKKWYLFFEQNLAYSKSRRQDADYYRYFYDLLEDSIKIRLRSDVPVGSCLSGGLDSSSIVCIANKVLRSYGSYHQEAFTSSFVQRDLDEREYAEEIIRKTGCIKNFVFPNHETLSRDLEDLIWHQEEPFGSLSIFSQWCVMRAAKEKNIKVLLDGQGGDELFLGYERYYVYFLESLLKQLRFKNFLREFILISKNSKLSIGQLIKYFIYFSLPIVRSRRSMQRSASVLNKDFLRVQREIGLRNFFTFKNLPELQKKEILCLQLPHLLRYEDRNSMAFSVEARLPFLDYRIVEFVYRLSSDYKIKNGWTKYILRQSMAGILPDKIMWRKRKIGFEVPQDYWLKAIKPRIKERFSGNIRSGQYIRRKEFLRQLEDNTISPKLLWKIYNLELWMNKFRVSS